MMIKEKKIDRINVDRRFHISAPDQTTRFKIDEYYRPAIINGKKVDICSETSDEKIERIINILKTEILSKSTEGDVLIFQPGKNDIEKTVNRINNDDSIDRDVIALPYYAQLTEEKKTLVGKIDSLINTIHYDRKLDFGLLDIEAIRSGNNTYRRAILVATNIAEASITIKTLKYVIDTGIEKTLRYDTKSRTNVLITNSITEASRLQRKGRVGRSSSGTVFYTYEEGMLINNKKQFNIATQDLHLTMLEMYKDNNDNIPINNVNIDNIVNGNNTTTYNETEIKGILNGNDNKIQNFMTEMILRNYYVDGEYYGYKTGDERERKDVLPNIYLSGYQKELLTDSYGKFYIIHPDELVIERNINGDVVKTLDKTVEIKKDGNGRNMMISEKMLIFWKTLIDSKFMRIENGKIIKTEIGRIYQNFIKEMGTLPSDEIQKMMFYGLMLMKDIKEINELIKIIAMIITIDGDIKKILYVDEKNYMVNQFKRLSILTQKSDEICKSDINGIRRIIEMIANRSEYIYNDLFSNEFVTKYWKQVEMLTNDIKNGNIMEINRDDEVFTKLRRTIRENNDDYMTIACMLAKPYSVYYKIINSDYFYTSVYNPNKYNIRRIENIYSREHIENTLVDMSNRQGFILGLSDDLNNRSIRLLIKIENDKINRYLGEIYDITRINRKLRMEEYEKKNTNVDYENKLEKIYGKCDNALNLIKERIYYEDLIISMTSIEKTMKEIRNKLITVDKSN